VIKFIENRKLVVTAFNSDNIGKKPDISYNLLEKMYFDFGKGVGGRGGEKERKNKVRGQ
jgi:hypothetical protein